MPRRFCVCPGCPACPPGGRTHTFDLATSPHQRCAPCQAVADNARYARRGTTSQRGYGSGHQTARRQAVEAFRPGQPCARCGRPIWRAEDADLGHADGQQGYRGLEHAACNRRAGALAGAASRKPAAAGPGLGEDEGEDDEDWSAGIA